MSYVSKLLLPDEKIVHIATLHWIIFVPGLILTALGGTAAFLSHDLAGFLPIVALATMSQKIIAGIGLVLSLAGLGLLLGAVVRQSATELVITDRRIIAKYGFISRATFEILINRVTGVNFDQTITGRVLGYGTVLVHGAGGDISPFDGVSNPQIFQRALMYVLDHEKH